jgi:BlaI family transcriptional regulator, penicillinase repressor
VPPTKPTTLTEAELRLMDVLWQKGSATVQEMLKGLPHQPAPAYNTVLTIVRILERKGFVRHQKQGRAFVYSPVVERQEATRSEIRRLLQRFFQNSHELLLLNILEDENLDAAELKRLREMLETNEEPE